MFNSMTNDNLIYIASKLGYNGSSYEGAKNWISLYNKSHDINKDIIKKSEELINNSPKFLNNYFINNGQCFEIAEALCSPKIDLCSNDIMDFHQDFKIKMLATLSPHLDPEVLFSAISRVNHDWNFDLERSLHLDAEVPFGVKYLDDIPVFSRIIAKVILLENVNIGGKWTKKFAQKIIDDIPFSSIENFDPMHSSLNDSDKNHILLNLKLVSPTSFDRFINLSKFNFDTFSKVQSTIKSKKHIISP